MQNSRFPGAIVKYLEGTEMENMAGDAFVLLVNVISNDTVNYVTDKFLQKLIASMDHINNEQTLDALIGVLVALCADIDKKLQKEGKSDE